MTFVDLDPNSWLQTKCLIKYPYLGNAEFYCHTPIEVLSVIIIFGFAFVSCYLIYKYTREK